MKLIIVGQGKIVFFLARRFASKGHFPIVIDADREDCLWLAQKQKGLVIEGDGTHPRVLEEAGARECQALLAVTPHDQDNLVACQLAAGMFGVPRTLALVNDPENVAAFRQLGVRTAFSTTHLVASLIEQQAGFDQIVNLLPVAEGRMTVSEVSLEEASPAAGQTLAELGLPAGALIACLIRGEGVLVPRGGDRLAAGDRLLLIGTPASYGPALRRLLGKEA